MPPGGAFKNFSKYKDWVLRCLVYGELLKQFFIYDYLKPFLDKPGQSGDER
jgi:hypothetical protein